MVNLPATGKLCDYRLPPKSFPAEKQLPFTAWKNTLFIPRLPPKKCITADKYRQSTELPFTAKKIPPVCVTGKKIQN